jgi:hypothetical protein
VKRREESECDVMTINIRGNCEDEAAREWDIMKGNKRGCCGGGAKSG